MVILIPLVSLFCINNINTKTKEAVLLEDAASKDKVKSNLIMETPEITFINETAADSKEYQLYQLFEKIAAGDGSDTEEEEFFSSLKDMDWRILFNIRIGTNTDAASEIQGWLYSNDINSENHIKDILKATKGLDGAMSEGYSGIVAKLFRQDKSLFVKCLGEMPEADMEQICFYVAYGCSYFDMAEISVDTKKMLDTEKLTKAEAAVVNRLMYSFEHLFE